MKPFENLPRILFVSLNYPPPLVGGSQIYWNQILTHLPPEYITLLVSSTDNALADQKFDAQFAFKTIRLPVVFISHQTKMSKWRKLVLLFRWWRGLNQYVQSEQYDLVIMQDIYNLGLFIRILCQRRNIPYIVATYGEELGQAKNRKGLRSQCRYHLYVWVMRGAKAFTAITEATAQLVEQFGIARSRIKIIYPPTPSVKSVPDEDRVQAVLSNYGLVDTRFVFSISRLIERKGYDYLLQAWAQITDQFPDVKLVIGGRGPMYDRLNALIDTLKIRDSVLLIGFVEDDVKNILYSACEFFIMPNRALVNGDVEGYGIVFNEASTFGKVVIGGNSGGTPESIVDGYTGWLVDSKDISAIASTMIRVLEPPEEAAQMGQNGKRWVAENRSPQSAANQLSDFLTELV